MSVAAWQSAAADAADAKAESLDLTIGRLEGDITFLELDLGKQKATMLRATLGTLKAARNDYRAAAEQMRDDG